jgi:hypothetical protein
MNAAKSYKNNIVEGKQLIENGFVFLSRNLLESKVFANPITLKIWIWLLLKAQYVPQHFSLQIGKGFEDVTLKRGQVLYGRKKAAKELQISGSTIEYHLKKLMTYGNIERKSNTHYSIITICNYDTYQDSINYTCQQVDSRLTADNQQPSTYNNIKKVNNNKTNTLNKTYYGGFK